MKHLHLAIALACFSLPSVGHATPTPDASSVSSHAAASVSGAHPWIADVEDNICGISTLKRVSKPAVVDFATLLQATPQMEEMDRDGIDPDSAEGKALRKAAQTLITKSCEKVRKSEAYCSVWKAIAHEDGRTIPDITDAVLEEY